MARNFFITMKILFNNRNYHTVIMNVYLPMHISYYHIGSIYIRIDEYTFDI